MNKAILHAKWNHHKKIRLDGKDLCELYTFKLTLNSKHFTLNSKRGS